jgi:hypothetical protein
MQLRLLSKLKNTHGTSEYRDTHRSSRLEVQRDSSLGMHPPPLESYCGVTMVKASGNASSLTISALPSSTVAAESSDHCRLLHEKALLLLISKWKILVPIQKMMKDRTWEMLSQTLLNHKKEPGLGTWSPVAHLKVKGTGKQPSWRMRVLSAPEWGLTHLACQHLGTLSLAPRTLVDPSP